MSEYHPIIGIPCRYDTSGRYAGQPVNAQNVTYTQAVIESGGIPVLFPIEVLGGMLETLFCQVDGLLFSGGGDVDPSFYNQSPQVENLSDIQQERDEHELLLMKLAIQQQKPLMAICRGVQVMNVAAGGNLWQDLASQNPHAIRHDFYYQDDHLPRDYIAHDVMLDKNSRLYHIVKQERLAVNSLHHQALKEIGPLVQPVGCSEDGVVEVLEVPDHPFAIGVQWHPEELFRQRLEARQLFAAFIDATRQNQQNGH